MENLYTVPETIEYLRISRPNLYRLIKRGELRPISIGKRTLFPESEVERFVNHLKKRRRPLTKGEG